MIFFQDNKIIIFFLNNAYIFFFKLSRTRVTDFVKRADKTCLLCLKIKNSDNSL